MTGVQTCALPICGDQVGRGNRPGLQQGFRLWQRQPAFPVAGSAWEFQYETTTTKSNNNAGAVSNELTADSRNSDSMDRSQLHQSTPTVLPRMLRNYASAARTTAYHGEMNPTQYRPVLVDLTVAAFHHCDYLCFLQHPVLAALREETARDWESARFGVATWLSLVAPTHGEGLATHHGAIFLPSTVVEMNLYLTFG